MRQAVTQKRWPRWTRWVFGPPLRAQSPVRRPSHSLCGPAGRGRESGRPARSHGAGRRIPRRHRLLSPRKLIPPRHRSVQVCFLPPTALSAPAPTDGRARRSHLPCRNAFPPAAIRSALEEIVAAGQRAGRMGRRASPQFGDGVCVRPVVASLSQRSDVHHHTMCLLPCRSRRC